MVLLGKAGGQEMMAGSDLDLMLIYDHAADASESDGPRRLPPSQYYIRAAHAVVAALTAPGVDGALYAVDMRLRPSGNKGPVAVSLESFRRYHADRGLDLGADGADPGTSGRRSARPLPSAAVGHRRRPRRGRPGRGACGRHRHAAPHAAGVAAAAGLGT